MKKVVLFTVVLGLLASSTFFGCEHRKESSENVLQKLAKIQPIEAKKLALKNANGKIIEGGLELENGLLVYSYDIQMPDKTITEVQINAKNGAVVLKKVETSQQEAVEAKEEGKTSEKEGVEKAEAGEHEKEMTEKGEEEETEKGVSEKGENEEKEGLEKGEKKEVKEAGEENEEAGEKGEASETEKSESGEMGESTLVGTIPVVKGTNLKALAKINKGEAETAALKLVEGKVEKVRLENEDGYVVYNVKVKYKGNELEVLVDAGNGKVVAIEEE